MIKKTQEKLYVAPANPAGRSLMAQLISQGNNVVGLIDNIKAGEGISHPSQVANTAKVIVAKGSFQSIVSEQLIKNGIFVKNIEVISPQGERQQYSRGVFVNLKAFTIFLFIATIKLLRLIPYRHRRVYYSESFIDANLQVLYCKDIAASKVAKGSLPLLIVDKRSSAIKELDAISMQSQPVKTFFYMLFARSYIVDHESQSLLFSTLRELVPVVQLWHGLPYKHLAGNAHYSNVNDACFISSSNWFNDNVFSKIFKSKQFIGIGYPRNDVFFETQEQRCWVNSEPLSVLEKTIRNTGKIIIYAPTYRDSKDNNYPLNLVEINNWCKRHHCSFILKYHPFIYRLMAENMGISASDELTKLPDFSHIYIFPNGKNVYPWLADAAMLITDYSSIAFDFMLSGKPILYYQFDKKKYEELRGKPLVGDDVFVQGEVITKFDDLLPAIEKNIILGDESMKSRPPIVFNDQHQACSRAIITLVSGIERR